MRCKPVPIQVFIVEDEPHLQLLYKHMFTLKGIDILDIASNGEEAVSKFRDFSKKPDIILMDFRMPLMNGIDASKKILLIDKTARIIFTSADNSVKDEALSLGVINFLLKPLDLIKLIDQLPKIVNDNETEF